ncbi:hypothetical protein BGZ98_002099 [Dissophora globulifera]|nr:hypothetical protein BGZ98_002099 [Dissophora globulifera]
MDVYDSSSISTSSRLTPLEEAELQNSSLSTGSPQTFLDSNGIKRQDLKPGGETGAGKAKSNGSGGGFKPSQPPSLPSSLSSSPQQRRILIAVSDKSSKRSTHASHGSDGGTQIQASAIMDDTEFEMAEEGPSKRRIESPLLATAKPMPPGLTSDSNSVTNTPKGLKVSEPRLEIKQEDQLTVLTGITGAAGTVISSGASILSASPTLTSNSTHQRRTSSITSHSGIQQQQHQQQHQQQYTQQYQHTTSSLTLEATAPPLISNALDPEHFLMVFRELNKCTEQIELLNDQILESMTLYQPPTSSELSAFYGTTSPTLTRERGEGDGGEKGGAGLPTPSPEEHRRRMKGKEKKAIDSEEDRFCIAQSFTELIMDAWPRIYKIPPEPRTAQMTKHRIKTAMKLKDAIVTFWSMQSHFNERAQLILDVYQDPTELEHGNRIRMLKSRHLNNLLSQEPLNPHDIRPLVQRYQQHQDKIAGLSEKLQNVWLGILMLLGDPDQTQSSRLSRRLGIGSSMHHLHGGGATASSSSSSYYLDEHSPPRQGTMKMFRLSGRKLLGLKVALLLAVGTGMIAMALVLNTR